MSKAEPDWISHIDALNERLFQIHALSNAIGEITQDDETTPLASLSLRLCEEVETHVAALGAPCRELSALVSKGAAGSGEENDR